MPCLVVLCGNFPFGRLMCLSVQWTVFLVTIVITCICGFGNVCFVLLLCDMSVKPLFDHPFIGTVCNALVTVTLHFLLCVQALCSCWTWRFIFCSLLLFRKEIAASYQDIWLFVGCISLRSLLMYYSLLSSCRFFLSGDIWCSLFVDSKCWSRILCCCKSSCFI